MNLEAAALAAAHGLHGVSLTIAAGEQVALIGPSGAGKTTLLHLLAAASRPAAGSLRLGGQNPWALRPPALRALRGRLFLAPQVPPLPPRQRVVSAVLAGALPARGAWSGLRMALRPAPADVVAAHDALARFGLADKLWQRVDRLSGGERQRVALARLLVAPATLWLVDEPLSALDPLRAEQALAVLTQEARVRGATLVVTLHQVAAAQAHVARLVGLRGGHLAFDQPARAVSPPMLAALYADEPAQGFEPVLAEPPAPALMCR